MIRDLGVPASVIRFGGIYGAGRNRLLERVSQGAVADAVTPAYTNRIHRDDCVGILEFCLLRDLAGEPLPDILLGVDDDPASEWEVLSWLASQLEAPALRHQPGDGQRNKRCSNRLLKSLGYRFRYADFRSGYAAILAQR
jgi:nucleoside-diphosphate-sugar epimerase